MLSFLFWSSLLAGFTAAYDTPIYPRGAFNSSTIFTTPGSAVTTNNASTSSWNCSQSWSYYGVQLNGVSFSNLLTFTSTYTYHNITASTEVLCDGHPRIVGGLTTIATGTNTTITSKPRPFTMPMPTCRPLPQECASLEGMYGVVPCNQTGTGGVRNTKQCGQCSIFGGTVSSAVPASMSMWTF